MDLYNIKKYCLKPENLIHNNCVEILYGAEVFFEKIFNLIDKAQKNIIIEFYEIADDKVGRKIAELLKEKASKGIEIRIIYDSAGSILTSSSFFKDMEKSGIKIKEYNPVRLYRPYWKWIRRDHRKIIAVDDKIAIVGGFNISLDYAPYSIGGKNWKDCGVLINGEAVYLIMEIFKKTWKELGGDDFTINKHYSDGNSILSIVSGSGIRNFFSIRRSYKYAIDNARDYIYITNAYFLPDRFIYRRLIKAVMRGVKVKIITPYKTDHPYVRLASWAMFPYMIKHGIEIYEWQKEVLHSKTAVIDGYLVSVGSHNLDHRSLHYNLELNVNIFDEKIGNQMKKNFLKDIENCKRITLEDCKKRIFSAKLLSQILYLFRSWL